MAINQYMTPAEQPIMDTYVPIPFQEMQQAGAMTQARYEDALSRDEMMEDQMSQLYGSSGVNVGGTHYEMPDAQAVSKFKSEIQADMDELTSSIPDKFNPEYKAKQRNIANKIKRGLSPDGTVGTAMGNTKRIEAWNKLQRENPQLADDPSLAMPFINQMEQYKRDRADGSVGALNLEGGIGDYVDVNKELADVLKNLSPEASARMGIEGTGIEGVFRGLTTEGIDSKRIMETVLGLIEGSPQLENAISRRAAMQKRNTNDPRSVQEIAKQDVVKRMGTMAGLFRESEVKDRIIKDDVGIARAKEKADRVKQYYATPLVLPTKGTGIEDAGDFRTAMDASQESINQAKSEYDQFISRFPKDESGNVIPVIDGDDQSLLLDQYKANLYNATNKKRSLSQLRDKAEEASGVTDVRKSDGYRKAFNKAYDTFKRIGDSGSTPRLNPGSSEPVYTKDYQLASESEQKAMLHELTRKNLEGYEGSGYEYKPLTEAISKRDDYYKERAKDRSFSATGTVLPDAMAKNMMKIFKSRITSKSEDGDEGGFNIKTTDAHTLDELNPKDALKNVDLSKSEFGEFLLDDDGTPTVTYNLYDNDGEFVRKVKQVAPEGLVNDLKDDGYVREADLVRNYHLKDDLGILNSNITSQTYSVSSPDGKTTQNMQLEEVSPGNFHMKVQYQNNDGSTAMKTYPIQGANNLVDRINKLEESLK